MITVLVQSEHVENVIAIMNTRVIQAVGAGLYQGGEMVREASLLEVPVRTGALKNSAITHPPVFNGQEWQVDIGYGGVTAWYAELVHERLGAWHNPPTKARYLIDPFNAAIPSVISRLHHVVSKAIESGP